MIAWGGGESCWNMRFRDGKSESLEDMITKLKEKSTEKSFPNLSLFIFKFRRYLLITDYDFWPFIFIIWEYSLRKSQTSKNEKSFLKYKMITKNNDFFFSIILFVHNECPAITCKAGTGVRRHNNFTSKSEFKLWEKQ